jgi:hypothetical protein
MRAWCSATGCPRLDKWRKKVGFADLRDLLRPVADAPVDQLSVEFRRCIGEIAHKKGVLFLAALAFFAACDAAARAAEQRKRARSGGGGGKGECRGCVVF